MANSTDERILGHFSIQRRSVAGIVVLKGADSRLEIYSDRHLHVPAKAMRTIRGITKAGEKITVCDAIGSETSGTRSYYGTTRYFNSLFPHFVAIGPRHLDTDKRVVSEISFTTNKARSLFYDHGAFGKADVKNAKRLMPAWARKNSRKIDYSVVLYYVDRGPMISIETQDRKIKVFNGISYSFPSPRGLRLKNEVRISIEFKKAKLLREAIAAAYEFKGFCGVVSQNKHSIRKILIRHKSGGEREGHIRLYSSYEEPKGSEKTDYRDNLVSGGFHKKEFEGILLGWMRDDEVRKEGRRRIIQSLEGENSYTIDRFVGAANAFDLLPVEVERHKLPTKVLRGLEDLSRLAKKLPQPYRDQLLNNMHRIKARNLREKIVGRFISLPTKLRQKFPEMEFVIDHCVRTRNYYVHGTKPKLSGASLRNATFFLTDTLEFIFVAAELSRYGWKHQRWIKESNLGKMKNYLRGYDSHLQELKNQTLR